MARRATEMNLKQQNHSGSRAFTLIELMIVVGIILTLVAITAPVVVTAKNSSANTVSVSNLRQCGMALLIYADDHGGIRTGLPTRPAADAVLATAPTCDPRDYFRAGCSGSSSQPMIGSFAYVRDEWTFADESFWNVYLNISERLGRSPNLLIDLFVSSKRHRPGKWFGEYYGNPHPDKVQLLQADGGVRLHHHRSIPSIGDTWQTIFLQQ